MIKRLFDLCLATVAFTTLSPLLIGIAITIFATMGRPIFFRQIRPGLHGKPFRLVKFRTMINLCDARECLLPDCERITLLGKWLRSTSIDELPELYNIIKGDMSIVGPRPLLMQYLDRYTPEQARRHSVRPGLTGWGQVNGRNTVLFSRRLKLDVWYVDNSSISLDLKIILLTIRNIFRRDGVVVDQDVHEIDDLGLYDDGIGVLDDRFCNPQENYKKSELLTS